MHIFAGSPGEVVTAAEIAPDGGRQEEIEKETDIAVLGHLQERLPETDGRSEKLPAVGILEGNHEKHQKRSQEKSFVSRKSCLPALAQVNLAEKEKAGEKNQGDTDLDSGLGTLGKVAD